MENEVVAEELVNDIPLSDLRRAVASVCDVTLHPPPSSLLTHSSKRLLLVR